MRVVTARQMAAIDRDTIAAGTTGLDLMRRAGAAISGALDAGGWLDAGGPVVIVCGRGNNGGDGLVIAQRLAEAGLEVRVLLLESRDALAPDARACYDALSRQVAVHGAAPADWPARLVELARDATLVIDAILGTGIQPPLRPDHAALCRALNDLAVPIAAVDIPTGVDGDDGAADPDAVVADVTVTVGLPKLGLLLPPGRDHAGRLDVVDIGFLPAVIDRHAGRRHVLVLEDYRALLPERPTDAHKYQLGALLVIAGSRAYGGAAHLAGLGALRSGTGLVSLAAPVCLETALRVGLPEAILRPLAQTAAGTLAPLGVDAMADLLRRQTAVAIGPGLGDDDQTDRWVASLVADLDRPFVLDADGLSALARQGVDPRGGGREVVLTPHAGELARLCGLAAGEVVQRRLELVPELAARWGVVLLLKGSPTVIGAPDGRLFINPGGHDALARGGTGDILTGLIGGLLAQGTTALDAALLGALVHGLAGELAATRHGRRGVLAREVAAAIGPVLATLAGEADLEPGENVEQRWDGP